MQFQTYLYRLRSRDFACNVVRRNDPLYVPRGTLNLNSVTQWNQFISIPHGRLLFLLHDFAYDKSYGTLFYSITGNERYGMHAAKYTVIEPERQMFVNDKLRTHILLRQGRAI